MEEYAKKQYILSMINTICLCGIFLVVLISALIVVPQVMHTFARVNSVMDQMAAVTNELTTLTESMGPSLESFRNAAQELEKLDFTKLNDALAQMGDVMGAFSWFTGH